MTDIKITDVRALPGDSAFLIDDGKTAVLYDTGFGFTAKKVAENIANELGERPLDCILLTHSHYDHALGSAYLRRVYPGVKVAAGAYAAGIFKKPSARAVMSELDRKFAMTCGVCAAEDLSGELSADIALNDGDVVALGDMEFTVIALPGHTRCSVGFYMKDRGLLLGSETLGVYFGDDTYLPSYLVGYEMTLESFEKAKALDIESMLIPHYGVVERREAAEYLRRSEQTARESAQYFSSMIAQGLSDEEILHRFEERSYRKNVAPTYPVDAFRLNTSIMIALIRKELTL